MNVQSLGKVDKGSAVRPLLLQLLEKFKRDSDVPLYVRLRKGFRYLSDLMLARIYLRRCSKVGRRPRLRQMPYIDNLGYLAIGNDFNFSSLFVQSHLVTGHAGRLEIGNDVSINFGAAISANEFLKIGNRVRIGPYAMIMDSDFHAATDRQKKPSAPIVIEDDVWLAGRVTVLKGSHIGQGSVITAGSVVSGNIPAGVIAGGVPARVLRTIHPYHHSATDLKVSVAEASDASLAPQSQRLPDGVVVERVKALVKRVFALADDSGDIGMDWGPAQIARWDSMGQLNLTLSIEEEFKFSLSAEEMISMTSVAAICAVVQKHQ